MYQSHASLTQRVQDFTNAPTYANSRVTAALDKPAGSLDGQVRPFTSEYAAYLSAGSSPAPPPPSQSYAQVNAGQHPGRMLPPFVATSDGSGMQQHPSMLVMMGGMPPPAASLPYEQPRSFDQKHDQDHPGLHRRAQPPHYDQHHSHHGSHPGPYASSAAAATPTSAGAASAHAAATGLANLTRAALSSQPRDNESFYGYDRWQPGVSSGRHHPPPQVTPTRLIPICYRSYSCRGSPSKPP